MSTYCRRELLVIPNAKGVVLVGGVAKTDKLKHTYIHIYIYTHICTHTYTLIHTHMYILVLLMAR